MKAPARHVQAFVEPLGEDLEAASALQVAQAHLAAGRDLVSLRRLRLLQLDGAGGDGAALAERLRGLAQFYNPATERCLVRTAEEDPVPAVADEALVLVVERVGERRPAAERWWRHATGERVEVREAVLWALRFAPGTDAAAGAHGLAAARDRGHGLLANPNSQLCRVCHGAAPPLDWITQPAARVPGRRARPA